MDAEKETLLQATLSLQDQLKESQVALLVEQVCSLRYLYLLSLIHFFSCNIMNFGNFCTMMRAVSYNLHPLVTTVNVRRVSLLNYLYWS